MTSRIISDPADEPAAHVQPTTFDTRVEWRGLRSGPFRRLLVAGYRVRRLRPKVLAIANRTEGGQFCSASLRLLLQQHHGVSVGAYSYGPCLKPGGFPPCTSIGRYVSIAGNVAVFRRNHPLENLSLHPYFYNPVLGIVDTEILTSVPLRVEHDAWLGHGSIVVPGCKRIGVGAVVAAGSVVTRDVPDFAIVAGNPAKVIGSRFPAEVQQTLLNSRWWEYTVEEMAQHIETLVQPLDGGALSEHPLVGQAEGTRS